MTKDRIIRSTGKVAEVRFVIIDATDSINKIGKQHQAQGYALKMLGEASIASLLLSAGLKFKGAIHTQFNYSGDLSSISAESTPMGLIRAKAQFDELQKIGNFEMALSPQNLLVRKFNEHGKRVQESITEMLSTSIAKNIEHYQQQSEQIHSMIHIDSQMAENKNELSYCAGFLVEPFPKVNQETIKKILENISNISSLKPFHEPPFGINLIKLLQKVAGTFEFEIHREIAVNPYCPCTNQRVKNSLMSLGVKELNSIIQQAKDIFVYCDFCRKEYQITIPKLKELIKNL